MKFFSTLLMAISFITTSCQQEQSKCDKAKENLAKAQATFSQAQVMYAAAVATMENLCGIVDKSEKAITITDVCAKAKQAVALADKVVAATKIAMIGYEAVLNSVCPAEK